MACHGCFFCRVFYRDTRNVLSGDFIYRWIMKDQDNPLFVIFASYIAVCAVCVIGFFIMGELQDILRVDVMHIRVKTDAWFVWPR